MFFQPLARSVCHLPVFMSALAQLPSISCAFSQDEQVAIFTANKRALEPMRATIRRECAVETHSERFVLVGCEDVPGFEAVALGKKVDVASVSPGLVAKARQVLAAHPRVRAFLFECTEMPPYADAVRAATGLPVYDAVTACDFFLSGTRDNPRFGLEGWQAEWDGEQESYAFGQCLNVVQRAQLLSRNALSDRQFETHRQQRVLRQELEANAREIEKLQLAIAQLRRGRGQQPPLQPPIDVAEKALAAQASSRFTQLLPSSNNMNFGDLSSQSTPLGLGLGRGPN